MNIHQTRSYAFTTGSATEGGAGLHLEELAPQSHLLGRQCTVQAAAPPGVLLRVVASATHARVLVEGGTLPSGTVLTGVLSTVSAQP